MGVHKVYIRCIGVVWQICKQSKNEATSKILRRVNSFICKPSKKKTFGYSRLGVENKFFPSKITFVPTQNRLYFIILCYKGRKNTIVPAVSQFTRYNLSVLSLSKGKAKIKNQGFFFVCGPLQVW